MSLKSINKPTGNQVELEISIDKESFEKAVSAAYRKNVGKMNVPGFRKGKAPRPIIEKMYGKGIFYDDALNALIPDAFKAALKESGEKPVGQPEFDVVSIEEEVVIKASFPVKPEVSVKNYKGFEVERSTVTTTEEEVDAEISQIRERNARTIDITDRPAANGDIAVIDYNGSVDGVPFDGGKAENYNLTLGSGEFIPGFEDQIVGHNAGDEFDVCVKFPDDYNAKDLAGKDAVFKTVLHEIKFKELPELDDDFAKDVSEFDTFSEYRDDVKAKITDRHNNIADSEVKEKLIDKLIDNLEADIPEAMFTSETENQLRDYDYRLRMQGLDLNTYLKYTGLDIDKMREQFRPRAERQVKASLALEKVAELENIEVTNEDIETEIKRIANMYNMEADKVKEQVSSDMISADLKLEKAVDIIKSNAVITEKDVSSDNKDKAEKDEK